MTRNEAKSVDLIDKFFNALEMSEMLTVIDSPVPEEMIVSRNGEWVNWKKMPGNTERIKYHKMEARYSTKLPEDFIEWHRRYFFLDCDCSIIRLPHSHPSDPFREIEMMWNYPLAHELIAQKLYPFGEDGNDTGPLVFDMRSKNDPANIPIRVYHHEYGGDLAGLDEIIFSSFQKLLECLTYFLEETRTRHNFEVIPEFFEIDPEGSGATGYVYWTSWIHDMKSNYEEFGY